MPTTRLPIASRDIARVAKLAQVGIATVRRYRATWDGTPRYQLRRAQEAAIERAAAEVDHSTAQLVMPVVDAAQIPGRAVAGLSPAGSLERGSHSSAIRAAGPELVASIPAPTPSKDRCHVTCLLVSSDGSETEMLP